ncbi:MAG: ComEC family competence protein, partial [Deltaproteobacteria bacterium]|nr:ComEC family competence protein [Deltaproteobacteria bacterium]
MARRPLIPLLLTFMAGIFTGHAIHETGGIFYLPMACAIIALLFLYLFLNPRLRTACILVLFFLGGTLLPLNSHTPSKLLPLAQQHQKVIVEGVLLEPAQVHQKTSRLNVMARGVFFHGKTIPAREKLLITVYRNAPENLIPGENIRFPARLRAFRNFKNPGAYDYETAMKIKGFSCAGAVSDGRFIVSRGKGILPFPYGYLEILRRPLRQFFHQNLAPEDENLFRALILGERQGISPALREPFNRTGLGHVLAVSGLHIGLVAWVAFFFFKWLLTRSYHLTLTINVRKGAALLTCIPVVLYASLAGLHVSCQRAMIMALVFFASILLDREKDMWSTLALAAFIILAMEPMALFSIGFQLSFTAVVGILWLAPPFLSRKSTPPESQSRLKRLLFRLKRSIMGLVIICLAAQIILLPLIVQYFHRVSPVALFANITTISLLGFWILPAGLLAALLLPLSPFLAVLILHLGATGIHAMMAIIRFWSQLPFASVWMVTPNAFETLLFYALLFCIFFLRKWHWTRPALMLVC